ncbi:hypothetical protein BT69DRAFT_1338472 [Atractiella rhizophila]|nr:hypothetical protein BT69DRAFT_1338472 [Atractiella rhizophila]
MGSSPSKQPQAELEDILPILEKLKSVESPEDLHWVCMYDSQPYRSEWAKEQNRLVTYAEKGQWGKIFSWAEKEGANFHDIINCVKLSDSKALNAKKGDGWTILHHAADQGVQRELVEGILALGGTRFVRTTTGETPLDLAKAKGHEHLYELLSGSLDRKSRMKEMTEGEISAIEEHLRKLVPQEGPRDLDMEWFRMCPIGALREFEEIWMPIPGMYGGFRLGFEDGHVVSNSFVRICGGSGMTYHINAAEAKLVESGWG